MAERDFDRLEPQEPKIEYARDWVWDECFYGTGDTTPPKDYLSAVALILVMALSISSFVSALSLFGFQLTMAAAPSTQESVSVSFHTAEDQGVSVGLEDTTPIVKEPAPTVAPDRDVLEGGQMEIQTAPQGLPNVDSGQTGALSWQEVYTKVIPSVVSISCATEYETGSGTGVIMHTGGYIITNAHVVENAIQIQVLLTDGRNVEAQCVGMDEMSDLAVLKIDAPELTAAEFGDSAALQVGDQVVAIGDPLGVELRGTMTDGIISGINRDITTGGRTMSVIQTTAALNEGNSGGPLVNCYGQVIGINTMKIGDYASNAGVEGLGFAIPITTVKAVVEQLMTQGYVSGRAELGLKIKTVSAFQQIYYRLPAGVIVTWVDENSDAFARGVEEGDILLSLDGVSITGQRAYEQFLRGCQIGQQVKAEIYRDGRQIELTITVGEDKG